MPTANGFLDLPVPPEKVAELARTAVARGGLGKSFFDKQPRRRGAHQEKAEGEKPGNRR